MTYSTAKKPLTKIGIDVIPIRKDEVDRYWDLLKLMIIQGLRHSGDLLSEAHLKEDIANNYIGRDPVFGPYTHRVHTDSSLTGFGPRLEVDGRYYVNNHFGVNAGIGSSLLVGSLSSSTNFTSWTANFQRSHLPSDSRWPSCSGARIPPTG